MNILLIGNPNVGKSAIFSLLTGVSITTSNYPGTTVEYTKGYMTYKNEKHIVYDVPGTYRLDPESEAEKVAAGMIEKGDILVNVVDSTNLERNLNLTLQLMTYKKPLVLVLNMWDDAKRKGIVIDVKKLEKILRIPVITTNGVTGEGLDVLPEKCFQAQKTDYSILTSQQRWIKITGIIRQVQNLSNRRYTFVEKLQDFSIHPLFSLPTAALLLYFAFKLIIKAGGFITRLTEKLFDLIYTPFILILSDTLDKSEFLHAILIGETKGNIINYEGAMGVLTTGVFVSMGIVLPYIILFYLVFGFLEDLGYLPRVAIILDKFLHRIGLHGFSVIPMFLACGCNVPGVMAIRNLETRRERFITAVITCTTIPCMAQTSLIMKAVGERGDVYIILTFATLLTVWAVLGVLLKYTVKGVTPGLLLEVPPYRIPNFKNQMKKLWMRVKCFLKEAVPYVMLGILIINFLQVTGVIAWIGNLCAPIIKGVFGLPEETVAALIIGIVRKDAAVALLTPIGLNNMQTVVAVVVLTLYFPCVATVTVLIKELGIKDFLKALGIMFLATISTGASVNILSRIYTPVMIIGVELALIFILTFIISQIFEAKNNIKN